MFDCHDTIAAVSTPAGIAPECIVRLSGPLAFEIVQQRLVPAIDLHGLSPYSCRLADYRLQGGTTTLPVTLYVMSAPKSYTREDVVELHTIGSPAVQQMLMNDLVCLGARPAGPGEFTRRAFLNGRIDLAQAESVMDVIHARSTAELKAAVAQLTASATEHLAELRDELIGISAYIEASIDFSDQDIEIISTDNIIENIENSRRKVAGLMQTGDRHGSGKGGVNTAIAGLPNAGKSSLLNRLAGLQHAVVTHVPGTTRDSVEATVEIDDVSFRLIDTAGLDICEDHISRSAIERSRQTLDAAQLVVYVIDGNRGLTDHDVENWRALPDSPRVLVVNKADLPRATAPERIAERLGTDTSVAVSAVDGTGIKNLREMLAQFVGSGRVDVSGHSFASNVRRTATLRKVDARLVAATDLARNDAGVELIAIELREALQLVGQLTGDVTDENVLDAIFSNFCIGK